MWPDRVSNPGSLTYESGALPIALRGPAQIRGSRIGYLAVISCGKSPPVGIWCQNDVVSTSMRRHHVASTLKRRHMPAGPKEPTKNPNQTEGLRFNLNFNIRKCRVNVIFLAVQKKAHNVKMASS